MGCRFTTQYFKSPMLLISSQFWKTAASTVRKVTRELQTNSSLHTFTCNRPYDNQDVVPNWSKASIWLSKRGLKDRRTASCFLGLGLRWIALNNLIDIDSCFGGAMFTRSYLSSEVSFSMPRVGRDRITAGEEMKQEEREEGCIESEGFVRWWSSSSGARISCELQ